VLKDADDDRDHSNNDKIWQYNSGNDDDDINLDSNESLASLNTIDSDLSCPLLVYN
jgi:hypothetical protein